MAKKIKILFFALLFTVSGFGVVFPGEADAVTVTCRSPQGDLVPIEIPGNADYLCSSRGPGWSEASDSTGAQAGTGDGGSEASGSCGVGTTILKCDGAGENPITRVFVEIFEFIAVGVGIITVAGIIFGGIKYATANGNTSQAEQGITTIVNAVIGLLLFIFMYALLNWLVPGGLFT